MDTKLKSKAVLITGVNNPYGVGAAAAKAFAAEGAKIFSPRIRHAGSPVS